MKPFVKILNGRYETDGVTVRSLTRGGTLSAANQGGKPGFRLRSATGASQVFYSCNMIRDLYRNALASSSAPEIRASLADGNRVGEFIVGSISDGGFHSISAAPLKHTTLGSARTEAERLAKLAPTKSFVVFEMLGSVQAVGVNWK